METHGSRSFAQRQEYKLMLKGRSTRLTQERINLLDKINFVWEAQRGGPRREQRATELVPEQACPAKFQNKIRKDYAKAMNLAGQNQMMMMMPGSFFPFAMAPGMAMPGMMSSEQTEDSKAKGSEGDDTEENKKTEGANASQYYNQMMAAMGWPTAPGSPSANPAMAFGFMPFAAPYMMGAAMGQIQSPDVQTSENDGKSGKKRKKTDKNSGKKKSKSTEGDDDEETENDEV
jgi:hypothetical protein